MLAPAVFLPLAAVLSEDQLLSWGWRVPFLLSAVVVVVGLDIRLKLDETPEFRAEEEQDEVSRAPLGVLFRDHWADVLRVFFAAFIAMVNTMFQVFALNFATSDDFGIGFSNTFMLWLAIIANIVAICTIPFWARLSDRVGRKPVFVTGVLGSAVLVTAFLGAIAAGNHVLTFVLGVLLAGVVYSMPNAVWPATYAEYFPTRVRLSGMAIGTQFGFALAGFTPTIAGALMDGEADNWYKVAAVRGRRLRHLRDRRHHRPDGHAPGRRPARSASVAPRSRSRSACDEPGVSDDAGLLRPRPGRLRDRRLADPGHAGARGARGRAVADLPADRPRPSTA